MDVPEPDAVAVQTLVTAALAAPSIRGSRPWRLQPDPLCRSLEVRAVGDRAAPVDDPARRAQHLCAGAAVFNLRVAATHLGWHPVVRLLPEPDDPRLLALVALHASPAVGTGVLGDPALHEALARRRSHRLPFTGRPAPEPVVAEMTAAARAEGPRLYVPDAAAAHRILALTAEGEERSRRTTLRARQGGTWSPPPGARRYGAASPVSGPPGPTRRIPVRDFLGPGHPEYPPEVPLMCPAQLALGLTCRDRPRDWLRAGQGLQRVLLLAAVRAVRTSALYQALEWPDLRRALAGGRGWPQFLIRFDYGPDGAPPPRAARNAVTAGREPVGR